MEQGEKSSELPHGRTPRGLNDIQRKERCAFSSGVCIAFLLVSCPHVGHLSGYIDALAQA
jgi:hypothetical protein